MLLARPLHLSKPSTHSHHLFLPGKYWLKSHHALSLFALVITTKHLWFLGHTNRIKLSSSWVSLYPLFHWIQSPIHFSSGVNQKNFIIGDTWIQGSQNTSISCNTMQTWFLPIVYLIPFPSPPSTPLSPSPLELTVSSKQNFWYSLSLVFLLWGKLVCSWRYFFFSNSCCFICIPFIKPTWKLYTCLPSSLLLLLDHYPSLLYKLFQLKFHIYYPECNHTPIPDVSPSFCDFDTWLTVTPSRVLPYFVLTQIKKIYIHMEYISKTLTTQFLDVLLSRCPIFNLSTSSIILPLMLWDWIILISS